ncbi:septum formation protein Maf [Candidatus Uhrbacteria bacterium]|nr:septum formation protein Maf [Candidatus Uhrbacteria bacterium]
MNIILGSSSPSRKAVLESMGFEFTIISPDIDERAIRRDDPRELVTAIAQAKMDAVLKMVQGDAIVITSDQVMVVDGQVREKPATKEEAYAFIGTFVEKPQIATSATVVCSTANGKRVCEVVEVTVTFDPIPQENIREFVETEQALKYAGGLAAEHPLFTPYVHVDGEWEALMGLPKAKTLEMIQKIKHYG